MYDSEVSVLMPVYNGEMFLGEAIESILKQTLANFEFIIVCDPSTDNSLSVIQSYKDPRIILLTNEKKIGLAASLNRGLKTARGKYVVRMDADDMSMPERLARQTVFMEKHRDVGVCGSWLKIMDYDRDWIRKLPVDQEELKIHLLFGCPIAHPTVIMRREMLVQYNLNYNPAFLYSEDYDLWSRCARHFPITNQGEVLYLYRHHPEQASRSAKKQEWFSGLVMADGLRYLGVSFTDEEMELHQEISVWRIHDNQIFAAKSRLWLNKLIMANQSTNYYPEPAFSETVKKRWEIICEKCRVVFVPLDDI